MRSDACRASTTRASASRPVVLGGRADRGHAVVHADAGASRGDIAAFLHSLSGEQPHRRAASQHRDRQCCDRGRRAVPEQMRVVPLDRPAICRASPTGITDPKLLQQDVGLLPGTGGTRGGGAATVRRRRSVYCVTLANGRRSRGRSNRLDDFMVSLKMADGDVSTPSEPTGPNAPKVELRDPFKGHRDLLQTYSDADIHNITAYPRHVEVDRYEETVAQPRAWPRRRPSSSSRLRGLDSGVDQQAARRIVAHLLRRLHGPPLQLADADQSVERQTASRSRGRRRLANGPGPGGTAPGRCAGRSSRWRGRWHRDRGGADHSQRAPCSPSTACST